MSSVNGAASSEKFLINCWKNPTKPKNDHTCFLVVCGNACSIELILSWQGCNVPSLTMCPEHSILANPMTYLLVLRSDLLPLVFVTVHLVCQYAVAM